MSPVQEFSKMSENEGISSIASLDWEAEIGVIESECGDYVMLKMLSVRCEMWDAVLGSSECGGGRGYLWLLAGSGDVYNTVVSTWQNGCRAPRTHHTQLTDYQIKWSDQQSDSVPRYS